MPDVSYSDGTTINFSGNPTPQDIEEAYNQNKGINQQSQEQYITPEAQAFSKEWDRLSQQSQQTYQQQTGETPVGPVTDMAKGIAKGFIEGGISTLRLGQNAIDLLAKMFTGAPAPIDSPLGFPGKRAEIAQQWANDFFGPIHTVAGKIAEKVGILPSTIAQLGTGEGAGLMGMKGGLGAFATLGALQNEPQGAAAMARGAVGGLITGALINKAGKMGPVGGNIVAGATFAIPSLLAGNSTEDVLADAIFGMGLNTLSSPKTLATFMSAPKDISSFAKDNFDSIKEESINSGKPFGEVLKTRFNEQVGKVKDVLDNIRAANEKIQTIETRLNESKTEMQESMENFKEQIKTTKETTKTSKEISETNVKEALTDIEKQQNKVKQEITEMANSNRKFVSERIVETAKELHNKARDIVVSLQSGKLNKLLKSFSESYESRLKLIGSKLQYTKKDGIDVHSALYEKLADAGLDREHPVFLAIKDEIQRLKFGKGEGKPIKLQGEERPQTEGITPEEFKGGQIGSRTVSQKEVDYILQKANEFNQSKNIKQNNPPSEIEHLGKPLEFEDLKDSLDRVLSVFGRSDSYEADLVRHTFGSLIDSKLGDPIFTNLQKDYRQVIGLKKTIANTFGLKTSKLNAGIRLLEMMAKGGEKFEFNEDAKRVIDVLENGYKDLGKGLGEDFFGDIKRVGTKLLELENLHTEIGDIEKIRIDEIGKQFLSRIETLKKIGKLSSERLEGEHDLFIKNINNEIDKTNAKYDIMSRTLKEHKQYYKDLQARKRDIAGFAGAIAYSLSGFGMYSQMRVTRGIFMAFGKKSTGFGHTP